MVNYSVNCETSVSWNYWSFTLLYSTAIIREKGQYLIALEILNAATTFIDVLFWLLASG